MNRKTKQKNKITLKKRLGVTKHARKRLQERNVRLDSETREKCSNLGMKLSGLAVRLKFKGQTLVLDLKGETPVLITAWEG